MRGGGVVILRLAVVPLLLWPLLLAPGAAAVWLNLPASGTKCVSEEIQPNVVVLANYAVASNSDDIARQTIAAKVTSPYGNTLHNQEHVSAGQFAFTTTEAGSYVACFWIDSGNSDVGLSVSLDWKIGIAAKDWDSVAKKDKIEGVELELTKLEAEVQAIHANLLYLKSREALMREVSETTNARVALFSILSLGVCIVVSILQSWHLKSYFRKKKLI
ncbi:hypothetical protein C4D60_Mb03t21140 [Musa balbisiana]|uniref:GOLD domain-containing protein n=1 Tax=Musa balbisiana TaxID=52838 RepID=A0A4S8JBE3_MUSBA|nr:hypothetical protein C4D60_Mb03t21140 [Musa balbisiana]